MTAQERASALVDKQEEGISLYVTGHPYLTYKGIDVGLKEAITKAIEEAVIEERRRCKEVAELLIGCDQIPDPRPIRQRVAEAIYYMPQTTEELREQLRSELI